MIDRDRSTNQPTGVLVGALNETVVLAGGTAIDVVGAAPEAASVTAMQSVTWQTNNVTLLQVE